MPRCVVRKDCLPLILFVNFHCCSPVAAARATTLPNGSGTKAVPLKTTGVASAPNDFATCAFVRPKCACQATFSCVTFDVLIWFSSEKRLPLRLPPVVSQLLAAGAAWSLAVNAGAGTIDE